MQTFSPLSPTSKKSVILSAGSLLSRAGVEGPQSPRRVSTVCPFLTRICLLTAALLTTAATAQTLARPNWAGSGLTASRWWHDAIFYRVDPTRFQASANNTAGDMRGLSQRLDYLQTLNVDAVILLPSAGQPQPDPTDAGFDDLLTAASQRHIRLIVALRSSTPSLLDAARSWLTRGAAGIELLATDANTDANTDALAALHQLAHTFPGQRVVLAGFDHPLSAPPPRGADLLETPLTVDPPSLPASKPNATPTPLLLTDQNTRSAAAFAAAGSPAAALSLDETAAILLLTSPGSVSLLYGQELGLQQPFDATMQWTPTNLTPPDYTEPAPPPPSAPAPPPTPIHHSNPNIYGAFVPYVAPKIVKPKPYVFDPNQLRGFSTQPTEASASNPRNAAEEDHDPNSLLNFYRRLIQLHHDKVVLRSGEVIPLHHDNILAWLRVLPASDRANPPILIVCNPTDQPIAFNPADDVARYHGRHLAFRTLLTSAPPFTIETTDNFALPPHTVYIGELYR